MIYNPSSTNNMWDTWIIQNEGKFFLYTLISSKGETRAWDCIGLAVSDDLLHWNEHGIVLKARPGIDYMGSGYTWKAGNRFLMNFSECVDGIQTIYFAESDDLINWRRLGDEYACRPDPQWYQVEKDPLLPTPRWDCIWVMPREGEDGFIGFLTATSATGIKRGVAGCVLSKDDLKFYPTSPVSPHNFVDVLEVDAVERIGNIYYMVYNGFYFLTSKEQAGPYEVPELDNNKLYEPSPYTYFGRFFRLDNKLLFNHHCIPRNGEDKISLGTLKEVYEIEQGRIILRYWPGNDGLKGRQLTLGTDECSIISEEEFFTREQHQPFRLDYYNMGKLCSPGLIVDLEIRLHKEEPDASVGMYLGDMATGTAFLAHTDGRIEFGPMNPRSAKPPLAFEPDHEVLWKVREGITLDMRMIVRGVFLELYMNDMFVQCYSMPEKLKDGIGILVEGGLAEIERINIFQMNIQAL